MKSVTRNVLGVLVALAGVVVIDTTAPAAAHRGPEDKKAREAKVKEAAEQSSRAAKAFDAMMQVPDQAIPRDLLERAHAVAVFPNVVKIAATVGAQAGRGVVSRRTVAGWSSPVFFRGAGGSFGAQIGASVTDYFMLLMNEESVEALMKDKFELGGEAAVAGGTGWPERGRGHRCDDAGGDSVLLAESWTVCRVEPEGCRDQARG
jgi:Las17-binding protein actin regulator